MLTMKDILKNEEVKHLLQASALQMKTLGYTEHSFRHCRLVSNKCGEILSALNYPERLVEMGRIAGYLHDIGNALSRKSHEQTGAVLAYDFLRRYEMPSDEAIAIMMAIANHDEEVGIPVNAIAAALILSDKADVHRSRVTNRNRDQFDIHDRVNYAVTESTLTIDAEKKTATLNLTIDTEISAVMEYFEIFLIRMKMCRNAAQFLILGFELLINQTRLL
ncbi:MAG: HD domain-containing protein [Clostridiaceae bacterium]|nr:HD domain-containing protein [Clostridiaceae bacterium]